MAISFLTDDPEALLSDFKNKIDNGKIVSWSYDKDGDFTRTPEQWKFRAWLRSTEESDRLKFHIISSSSYPFTWAIYAVFHGRLLESMISHCRALYTVARSPSKPTDSDAKPVSD